VRDAVAEVELGAAFEAVEDRRVEEGGIVHGESRRVVDAEAQEDEDVSGDGREIHEARCEVAEPEDVVVGEPASEVASERLRVLLDEGGLAGGR
jgi:hypothetical protein